VFEGELSPSQIALIIAKRIKGLSLDIELDSKVQEIETLLANINSAPVSDLFRLPSFCAGCPHNTSTKVPDDSFAFGGIGCHGMATFMPERKTYNLGQMGGEGVMWTGIAPFTETDHIFQNLGDGTYYHSGILALRAAIASKANITFKILVNDAIAMTGGQEISGKVQVDNLSWQVHSEGAKKVVVMTDYPEKYPANSSFAPGVKIYQRDELDKVQRELREIKGVTVILYDQYCATELRRRRKRGLAEEPNKRIFINPLVCEGCGDS
jgi:indolepyruvate ferredoxin oxidoreductase